MPGRAVQFTDGSTPGTGRAITGWSWAFGDGNTSTVQNPLHSYADDKSYTAELTVVQTDAQQDPQSKLVPSRPQTPVASAGTPSSTSVPLTGTAYANPTGETGPTHVASQWQVTTSGDTTFASPVHNPGDDTTNKVAYTPTGLPSSSALLARVRYKNSQGGYSRWSPAVAFTTAAASNVAPNTPATLTAGSITTTSALLTSSAFSDSDVGDTHAASQWQVTLSADTTFASPVISTGDDTTNKLTYSATGLSNTTAYRARVRHKDSAGNYSGWRETASTFTTLTPSTIAYKSTFVDSNGVTAEAHVASGSGAYGSLTKKAGNSSKIITNRLYGDNTNPGQYYATEQVSTAGQQILANIRAVSVGLYPLSWMLRWNRTTGSRYQVTWNNSTQLMRIQRYVNNVNDFTWNATTTLPRTAGNDYDVDIRISNNGSGNPVIEIYQAGVLNFSQIDSNTGKLTGVGDCGFIQDGLSTAGLHINSLTIQQYP